MNIMSIDSADAFCITDENIIEGRISIRVDGSTKQCRVDKLNSLYRKFKDYIHKLEAPVSGNSIIEAIYADE